MALSLHKILTLIKVLTFQLALLVSLGNFSQTDFSQLLGVGWWWLSGTGSIL